MGEKSEESLIIKRILEGETALFRKLVDANSDNVFALIYKMTGNREDSEELAQDVFVKAFFSLKQYRGDCKFSTWLYRIAYNKTVSKLRSHHVSFMSIDAVQKDFAEESSQDDIDFKILREKQYDALRVAIDSLNMDEKFLIVSFYEEGKSLKDLVEITGLSLSTVKVRLFRARKKIEEHIKTEDYES